MQKSYEIPYPVEGQEIFVFFPPQGCEGSVVRQILWEALAKQRTCFEGKLFN